MFRFALHMSGNLDTAEEVTQEVFLAMLNTADRYVSEESSLEGYLLGIARNQVRRHLKKNRPIAQDARLAGELTVRSDEWRVNEISKEQQIDSLRKAIIALPPHYREIVVLCDLEDMDYEEAAVRLGCPVGTVRSRLHRARAILQRKLLGRRTHRSAETCEA